jgi:hypothetical protein
METVNGEYDYFANKITSYPHFGDERVDEVPCYSRILNRVKVNSGLSSFVEIIQVKVK